MNSPHRIHPPLARRDLLRLSAAGGLAAVTVSGCSFFTTNPNGSTKPSGGGGKKQAADQKEAPALAAKVKAGQLPELAKRLPDSPLVVKPEESAGQYGGTFHAVLLGAADTAWLGRTVGYEPLLRFTKDANDVVPNIADVQVSDDAREHTIKLRAGMKWSDGKPFNADDIMFAYNDVLLNKELTPVFPDYLTSSGTPAKIEKLDDVTVKLTFPKPQGLLYRELGFRVDLINYPRHHLEQFHKKYNPDVVALAKKEQFESWTDLFYDRNDAWGNVDLPTLHAWVVKSELGKGPQMTFERNPYFWKTDTDGRQLPYFDKAIFQTISDAQAILLKATNGDLDMTTRHVNTLPNKPVLARNRSKGHYHFINLENTVMNAMVIALNLNHKDPVTRKMFQDKNFRIGLSYAINRDEMRNAVWQRQGVGWQCAPDDRSEYYNETLAKQYTEYDVKKANEFLDKAGLTQRTSDGYRLRPDGKGFIIKVEVASPALIPFWVDGADLVVNYWKKVGVNATVKNESRDLFYTRKEANEHDAGVWTGDGGLKIETLECRWYFPFSGESNFAELWQEWFTSRGASGEKPPAAPLKQMQLYWKLIETADEAGRKELFKQILQIAQEQFYVIGTVRVANVYGIVKNNFHNIPNNMPESAVFSTPAIGTPEQWYFSS